MLYGKTLLDNRWPVTAVLSDEHVTKQRYRYLDMLSDKWMVLEELVNILEPLEVVTAFLAKSRILPFLLCIQLHRS